MAFQIKPFNTKPFFKETFPYNFLPFLCGGSGDVLENDILTNRIKA